MVTAYALAGASTQLPESISKNPNALLVTIFTGITSYITHLTYKSKVSGVAETTLVLRGEMGEYSIPLGERNPESVH